MPPITVMIKPASGNCNMRCRYCFYHDITENREIESYGIMTEENLEIIIKKLLERADISCNIAFQGGEPTLAGLKFFRRLMEFEKKYNVKNVKISNCIQTNGYLIDEEWAQFLGENNFLVGLSLDGTKDIHDANRLDYKLDGTFNRVMKAAKLFEKYNVEFNILCVITSLTARHTAQIYRFFMKNNLRYMQFIPCLDPMYEEKGQHNYSLTPKLYGQFLKNLFDLWYADVKKGNFVYIRYFENLVGMLLGIMPEACGVFGRCSYQTVIEADGGVYPCDFYVIDRYRMGNLITDSFEEIEKKRLEIGFAAQSLHVHEKCKTCRWYKICRGGCRRDREPAVNDVPGLNYFCESYLEFFDYSFDRLAEIARMVSSKR